MEEITAAIQALQQQVAQTQTENQLLRDRLQVFEAGQAAAGTPQHGAVSQAEVLEALRALPEALAKMNRPKGLIDPRGLGKPQVLGEDAESKFRLWSVKLEDYIYGVYAGKSRDVLEWAAGMDQEITDFEVDNSYGEHADLNEQWLVEIEDMNQQLYTVLRATTEGIPFDVVENVNTGAGLEAWRQLHKRFDPSSGRRKRIMLQALTAPERASYDNLQSALERWKTLKIRYDKKKDQFGVRETLPDSLAMNSLEKLVPKELENHLLLNHARFRNFEEMEQEVVNYMEAKTGNRMQISTNFSKPSGGTSSGAVPMDVDSLVKVVSNSINSLSKGKGGGKAGNTPNKMTPKFDGTCDNCGKYGHRKKDCWSRPSGGKGSGGGASSRSASSSPNKKDGNYKFAGKCNHCGKVGHKKAECRALHGKGTGGNKGNSGNNPAKQSNANSLESHPEPEPASANGLELCGLEEICTLTELRSRSTTSSRRSSERPTSSAKESGPRQEARPKSSPRVSFDPTQVKEEEDDQERSRSRGSQSPVTSVASSVDDLEPGWIRCNLDTGASMTVFPKKMFEDDTLQEDGTRLRTASGEVIYGYGETTLHGQDTEGVTRKLRGRVADVHKVLVSASKMHEKGYNTWLGPGGGEIYPLNHPISRELTRAYNTAVRRFGKEGVIPVAEEGGVYNFFIKEERRGEGVPSPATPEEPPPEHIFRPGFTVECRKVPQRPRRDRQVCALEDEGEQAVEPERDGGPGGELVEARQARVGWTPNTPSDAERHEHEVSGHAVFRSWCPECLAATGYGQQHRRVDHAEDFVDTIVLDYFFMGEEEGAKPNLVAQDRRTGMMFATALKSKGNALDTTARKLLTKFIELLKSDGEHALVRLKQAAGKEAKCLVRAICEESPAGDSRANGEAESAVKEIKWRIRAINLMVEKKFGGPLPEGHPLATWIPRYAAEQANRFRVGSDGKTPEESRTGKRWVKPTPIFGEKVMIKPAGKGRRGDLTRMKSARFIGCHNRFGSVLGMTSEGILVGSSYHSLAEDEKWGALEDDLKGSPWDVRAYIRRQQPVGDAQPAVVQVPVVVPAGQAQQPGQGERPAEPGQAPAGEQPAEGEAVLGGPSASGQPSKAGVAKAWPVRREHLAQFGKTTDCPGCLSLVRGAGFQQIAHSEECRARIKRCLDEKAQREESEKKRLREEQQQLEERTSRPEAHEGEPGGGGASSSAAPAVGVPASSEEPMEVQTGQKRKGGEEGVQDVDDLLQEAEAEESPLRMASIQAMSELLGSLQAAQDLADIAAMDIIEVFSPARLNLEAQRFGLRQGAAIDLEEEKPDGGERWDLDKESDYKEVLDLIAREQPWLVTSSPPCSTFSTLRRLSNFKRDKNVVEEEEKLGRQRLHRSLQCCKLQASMGGYYLHEHPKEAASWNEPEVVEMRGNPETYVVQSPMCRFGMKLKNAQGELLHVRKETLWMTNSLQIALELQGTCENVLKGKEVHRHVQLVGERRAKAAQIYPKELVEAIVRGLKKELEMNHLINSMEEALTGPSPDDMVEWQAEMEDKFTDDASGATLDPELVRAARAEELEWLRKEKVYERIPASSTTLKPLELKWIDVNKGDGNKPKIRSRLVAKEIKKAKPLDAQLAGSETFSSTPPLEIVYALLSLFATEKDHKKNMKLAAWDISRAHFMGEAARDIVVKLPEEDRVHPEDTEPMLGRLLRSMYGTQDASKIFQDSYTGYLSKHGATFCPLCPSIFRFEQHGLQGVVHGDDFLVLGSGEDLKWLDGILNAKYTARWEATLGDDHGDQKEMFFLNRLIRYYPDGTDSGGRRVEVEADARHVEILIRDFKFDDRTKGCDIPEEKMTQQEMMETERQAVL